MARRLAITIFTAMALAAAGCASPPEATSESAPMSERPAAAPGAAAMPLTLPTAGLIAPSARHAGRNDRLMGRAPEAAAVAAGSIEQRQRLYTTSGGRPRERTTITIRSLQIQPEGPARR